MSHEPIPVVVFACNRPAYLQRALDSIFRNDDEAGRRIFVSQDGTDEQVRAVVLRFDAAIEHLSFTAPIRDGSKPDGQGGNNIRNKDFPPWNGYYCIAQHYGWAFRKLFDEMGLERLIVLEDDLEIASDFFNYIRAAVQVMDHDPTIWTVSAWNDNSFPSLVASPERLFRSDFFPGLGWLMTQAFWDEMRDSWPLAHWDQWLRMPDQRKGRSVICPEISRTYNFGREGVGGHAFFDTYLATIKSNTIPIDFSTMNLKYLVKDNYDPMYREAVSRARLIDRENIGETTGTDVKILYHGEESFNQMAEQFGLLPGFYDVNLPRCSYQGVVSFRDRERTIYLVPLSYLAGGEIVASRAGKPDS